MNSGFTFPPQDPDRHEERPHNYGAVRYVENREVGKLDEIEHVAPAQPVDEIADGSSPKQASSDPDQSPREKAGPQGQGEPERYPARKAQEHSSVLGEQAESTTQIVHSGQPENPV